MGNQEQEILEFIHRRFKVDNNWTNGNCYFFAIILKERFPQGIIYYHSVIGHFILKVEDNYYDFTGKCAYNEEDAPYLLSLDELKQDELWYARIRRDCIM